MFNFIYFYYSLRYKTKEKAKINIKLIGFITLTKPIYTINLS